MKKLYATICLVLTIAFAQGQIYEPEGINMSGQFNGWSTPPNKDVFSSATQNTGGKLGIIKNGTLRWHTSFWVSATDTLADSDTGTFDFLFISGPSTNYYQNKWADVVVIKDSLQTYAFNSGADNKITLNNGWYTMNWEDVGYANNRAIFMYTTNKPVTISSVSQNPSSVTPSAPVTVTVNLSGSKSAEEKIYVRYSIDNWATDSTLLATGSGSTYTATIGGQPLDTTVSYYVFTSTKSNITNNYDLYTINYDNNGGSNYSYKVQSQVVTTGTVSPTTYCSGTSISIPYTVNGSFNGGNKFYAELSDSSGSFTKPVLLDSIAATGNGTFSASLPKIGITGGTKYRVRVRSTSPAVTGNNNGQNITINLTPTASIAGADSITACAPDTVTFVASPNVAGATYHWYRNNGAIMPPVTNNTLHIGLTGNYKVAVTINGCTDTSTVKVLTWGNGPGASITPSGAQNLCAGDSVVLTTTSGTGLWYEWKKDNIVVSTSGNTYTAKTSGNYTVKVSNSTCFNTSATVMVTVSNKSSATFVVTGDTVLCSGDSVLFTSPLANGSANFTWQQNGNTVQASTKNNYATKTAGSYRLIVSYGVNNNCPDTSKSVMVSVNAKPTPTIAQITGSSTTFCLGDSILLRANGGTIGSTYQWVRNNTPIFNAKNQDYKAFNGGDYQVIISNGKCTGISVITTLSLSNTPTIKPTLTYTGGTTIECVHTGTAASYKWFKNGVQTTDVSKTITINGNGCYKSSFVDANGCESLVSDSVCTSLSVNTPQQVFGVQVYPNPANEKVNLTYTGTNALQVTLTDLQGRKIDGFVLTENSTLNISHIAKGIYLLHINNGEQTATQKLLVE